MISTTKKPATKTAPNLEPEGLRLVRAVLDHFAAPPREVQMLFASISDNGATLTKDGREIARAVRRAVADHLSAGTGARIERGFWKPAYRTLLGSQRDLIERAAPRIARRAPVELFALLCYLDERGGGGR